MVHFVPLIVMVFLVYKKEYDLGLKRAKITTLGDFFEVKNKVWIFSGAKIQIYVKNWPKKMGLGFIFDENLLGSFFLPSCCEPCGCKKYFKKITQSGDFSPFKA